MGIQWELSGKTSKNLSDASVYLADKGKKTDISIKNDFWKKMGFPDRVSCGVDKDSGRIYFREDKRGFSVTKGGSKTRVYFHMSSPHKEFIGDYDVYFDQELKIFYISRSGRSKKE